MVWIVHAEQVGNIFCHQTWRWRWVMGQNTLGFRKCQLPTASMLWHSWLPDENQNKKNTTTPALCLLKFLFVFCFVFYLNNLSGCDDVPQRCAGGAGGAWECCGTGCTKLPIRGLPIFAVICRGLQPVTLWSRSPLLPTSGCNVGPDLTFFVHIQPWSQLGLEQGQEGAHGITQSSPVFDGWI